MLKSVLGITDEKLKTKLKLLCGLYEDMADYSMIYTYLYLTSQNIRNLNK